jgi:primosomal replication protein N
MSDRNEVRISGVALTDPILTQMMGSKTSICSFLIQSNESFVSNKKTLYHSNVILVEALGKNASFVFERIVKGLRYEVVGYLRTDQKKFSVRAFVVNKEQNHDSLKHIQGLEAALDIVMNSPAKEAAIEELRRVLDNFRRTANEK